MARSVLVLAALLAACATPDEPAPQPVLARATAPVASDTAAVLVLDAEGLRVADASSGTARPVSFGTPEPEAVAAVEALRGVAPERSQNAECGAGPLTFASWPDGFAMLFQGGAFAGWAQSSGEAATLTAMSGLGIGSTRAELDAAYAVTIEDTTLGTEFSTGDLFGILSGPGPDATVEHLWAGVSCAFR